jgi:hypothetical protein
LRAFLSSENRASRIVEGGERQRVAGTVENDVHGIGCVRGRRDQRRGRDAKRENHLLHDAAPPPDDNIAGSDIH